MATRNLFFDKFKVEIGDLNRFEDTGEFFEAIYQHINYYNNKRIHTSLKTYPVNYRVAFYKSRNSIE